MKIGMVTDSLAHLPFEDMLDTAAALRLAADFELQRYLTQ
jgi:sugar phosphate isomerase/epimerase